MAAILAAVLMLAGALPAAAEGPAWKGAMDWLSRLWAEVTVLLPAIEASCDAGPEIDPGGCPRPQVTAPEPDADAGPEIDPLG
ncbi:MAG TPA: hypothetical protein VE078_04630 [Thermoanaerobaculia bacterium]|nr:hypothetical protein [Thermoanaerobaculia bacterium]